MTVVAAIGDDWYACKLLHLRQFHQRLLVKVGDAEAECRVSSFMWSLWSRLQTLA
jgi:hypothetical protein